MMAEEEAGFDPTMKKKKKKKPFDPSGLEGVTDDGTGTPGGDDEGEKGDKASPKESGGGVDDDLDNLDFTKKKKKKKPTFNLDDLGDAIDGADGKDASDQMGEDDLDFNNMKKKKKKKKMNLDEATEEDDLDEGSGDTPSGGVAGGGTDAWRGTDRDYTYDELLQRVFNIMRERNPDMVAGEKRKFVMKPPQVLRVGTKKTSFANFLEITRTLRRAPKHLQAFLLAELGTSGSVDANNQLIIKGRFQQKQIENILRRYIKEYVTCHTCRAPETILEKDTRLNFLRCEKCGSRCSVQSIKSGFQAVTAKRAAIRAKAT